jgi:hypothetical protein
MDEPELDEKDIKVALEPAGSDDAEDDGDEEDEGEALFKGHSFPYANYKHLPVHEKLEKWQEHLFPPLVDIISGLGGASLFFISAEALIHSMLNSGEVQFETDCQFLHAMYAMEQVLNDIKMAGGVFRLVFFNALRTFYTNYSDSIWALREVFLIHCQQSGLDHVVFDHWELPEWKDYLITWRPSFLLGSDAAADVDVEDDEDDDEETREAKRLHYLFLGRLPCALLVACLNNRVPVALVQGLRRKGNSVHAFTVGIAKGHPSLHADVAAKTTEVLALVEPVEKDPATAAVFEEFQELANKKVKRPAGARAFVTTSILRGILEEAAEDNAMTLQFKLFCSKAFVLHDVILSTLSLQQRSFHTLAADEWALFGQEGYAQMFVGEFFSNAMESLGQFCVETDAADLTDFFDGRVFRHVAYALAKADGAPIDNGFLALDADSLALAKFLWENSVPEALNAHSEFLPILTDKCVKGIDDFSPPKFSEKPADPTTPVLDALYSDLVLAISGKKDLFEAFEQERGLTFDNSAWDGGALRAWLKNGSVDSVKHEETLEDPLQQGQGLTQKKNAKKKRVPTTDREKKRAAAYEEEGTPEEAEGAALVAALCEVPRRL